MTACEYSGRPPNTNSHQPSLRPEQHTARSECQLFTRKRNMQNNTRGKSCIMGNLRFGTIILKTIHMLRTNKPYCVGASGIGRGERTLSWGRAQHRRRLRGDGRRRCCFRPPDSALARVPNLNSIKFPKIFLVFELKQKCDKKTSFVRPVGHANMLAKNSPEVKFLAKNLPAKVHQNNLN